MKTSALKRKAMVLFAKFYIGIAIIIIVGILAAGYSLFVKDIMTDINEIGVADLESKEAQYEERSETLIRLKRLNERFNKITEDDLRQLEKVLPSQAEIPHLVIELKDFVKNSGLEVYSLDVGPMSTNAATQAVAGTAVKNLAITLVVGGLDSYSGVKNFLDAMSNNLPLVELNSFSYSPAASEYSLNLTTYYQ